MGNIIVGIDTGGTFTDGFFSDGTRIERTKVDTTPHDLTVCFMNCLKEGAGLFGFDDLRSFLKQVQIIRFSSTTSTNVAVQRIGTRVGLLVSKGFEDSLTQLPDYILTRNLVRGIEGEVSITGEVVYSVKDTDIIEALKHLLDNGARILVISLHNAHLNPQNERRGKQIINTYYPKHYLGAIPVIPAVEFCNHPDEVGRTNLAVLDAYVHPKVSGTLYHAEDQLRDHGYPKPLLVVDSNGGCSRVAKTKATDLMLSVPVAGYTGAIYWAKKYDEPNVIIIDIGGTSFDIGLVVNGGVLYSEERRFLDIPVATPMFEVTSFGLGGGSIAKVNLETKGIEVGPESAGALPGPACYDLGGDNPTVTDATVAVKRIDPDYFLGGKRKLNADSAHYAIRKVVAEPLGLSVEEAALAIIDKATEIGNNKLREVLSRLGKSPRNFALFACGGAGPTYGCEIAEKLGIPRVYTFPFSATFGAFGSSLMDLTHIYMRYKNLPLVKKGRVVLDIKAFNNLVKEEQAKAIRDVVGEGFAKEEITWELQLEIGEAEQRRILITSPKVLLDSMDDAEAILESYKGEKARLGLPDKLDKGVQIEVFYLRSRRPLFKYEFQTYRAAGTDPSQALKTERQVLGEGWLPRTKVYERELLKCGNIITGPAIIESRDTTLTLPKGWKLRVDKYLNGVIKKEVK